jgi:hypothetical protein
MLFAGTVLGLIGAVNCIQGIAALSGSSIYPDSVVFEFGNLRLWGWLVLIAGIVQLVVSFAIFAKSPSPVGSAWRRRPATRSCSCSSSRSTRCGASACSPPTSS